MNQFEALLGILAYGVVLFLVGLIWIKYKKAKATVTEQRCCSRREISAVFFF